MADDVKLLFSVDPASQGIMNSQIQAILRSIGKRSKLVIRHAHISNVGIADLQRQIETALNNINPEININGGPTKNAKNSYNTAIEKRNSDLRETISLEQAAAKASEQRRRSEEAANREAEKSANRRRRESSTGTVGSSGGKSNRATVQEVEMLLNRYRVFAKKNPRVYDTDFGIKMRSTEDYLGDILRKAKAAKDGLTEIDKVKLKEFANELRNIDSGLTLINKKGDTLTGKIKKMYEKYGGWSMVTKSIYEVSQGVRIMVDHIRDIDSAMTELKKVTNETDATYSRFLEGATDRAEGLGVTIADTVNATADFARMDYSLGEATELADAALVYKNVGDGIDDISVASQSIISTMKAFGIEAEGAMLIVDKFNEVGLKQPFIVE